MIKSKIFKTNQSQEISNIFAKRERKEHKLTQVPKQLQWLLLQKNSKTTSLLLDIKPKHVENREHEQENRKREDLNYTEILKQKIQNEEVERNTLHIPGLLTETNTNVPKKRKRLGSTLFKNQPSLEGEQYPCSKRSYSQLKLREEILNVTLQNKPVLRRPLTGIRHKSSVSSCKQTKAIQIQQKFSTAFRTTKLNENIKLIDSCWNQQNQQTAKKETKIKKSRRVSTAVGARGSRKMPSTRHQKYESLIQNFELKPWQNKQYYVYDDLNTQ